MHVTIGTAGEPVTVHYTPRTIATGATSIAGPFTGATVQQAVDRAGTAGGGIVTLPAGVTVLPRPLLMRTGVRLQGHPNGSTLKAGPGFLTTKGPAGGHPLVTTSGASNVTLAQFTADHSGDTLGGITGRLNEGCIDARLGKNIVITGVRVRNPFAYSILVASVNSFLIEQCDVLITSSGRYDQLDQYHILNSANGVMQDCVADGGTDGDDGIAIQTLNGGGCHDLWFLRNRIRCGSNGHLIQFAVTGDTESIRAVTIQGNTFHDSPRGIMVGFYGPTRAPVIDGVVITGNIFLRNSYAVSMIGGTRISNVVVTGNQDRDSGTFAVAPGNVLDHW